MTASDPGIAWTTRERLASAVETSRLIVAARGLEATLARWGRGSRIVRWFLVEPKPAIVVTDLRETYTIGPVIRLVGWSGRRASQLSDRTGFPGAASSVTSRFEAAPLRVAGVIVATVALLGALTSLLVHGAIGGASGGWLLILGTALLATRERHSASELAETRVGRTLVAAFEPPDAPGRRNG